MNAQLRLIARAPNPVSVSDAASGGAGTANFRQTAQRKASAGSQEDRGQRHADLRPSPRAPTQRGEDQKVDRRILEEINTVGQQGDRADVQRDNKLHAEIGEVEKRHEHHGASKRLRHRGHTCTARTLLSAE